MATYNVNRFGDIEDWEDDEWDTTSDDEEELERDYEKLKTGTFQRWRDDFVNEYKKLESKKYKISNAPVEIQTEWSEAINRAQDIAYKVNKITQYLNLKPIELHGLESLGLAPVVLVPLALGGGGAIVLMMKFVKDARLLNARYETATFLTKELITKKKMDPAAAAKLATKLTNERYPPDYGLFGGLYRKIKWPLLIIAAVIIGPKIYKMVKHGK